MADHWVQPPISGKHVQGPVFPLVHATVSYFLSPSASSTLPWATWGHTPSIPICVVLILHPLLLYNQKKSFKTFLMFPSQWTELEALFLSMMGAKKLLRPRPSVPPASRTESCLPETHLHWPWSPCPQNLIEREQKDSITHGSAYNKQGPSLATKATSVYIHVCVLSSTYADIMYA